MSDTTEVTTQSGPSQGGANSGTLTANNLQDFRRSFEGNPSNRLMQNVVTQHDVNDVALDRSIVAEATHSFSTVLDDWSVTNQARTGRCWMFAGLNLFRTDTRKLLNLKQFEFSQSYLMFWDKLERANFVLEAIIETAHLPVDDRTVAWLLQRSIEDGGQWDMFVGLVKKHGVAPKSVMTETQSSSSSARMNASLNYQMRQGAKTIRELYANESGLEQMRGSKNETLQAIYQVLCIHLGTPPDSFDWQWKDKDDEFHRDGKMTPLDFAAKYVDTPWEEYVCLVHDPAGNIPHRAHLHHRLLGQHSGRPAHQVPQRGNRCDERHRLALASGRQAGLDGLRHRKADAP